MAKWSGFLAGLLTLLACLGAAAAEDSPTRFLVEYEESSGEQVPPPALSPRTHRPAAARRSLSGALPRAGTGPAQAPRTCLGVRRPL